MSELTYVRGMNEGILTSEVIPSGRENYRAADGPDRRMETSTEDSSGGSLSDLSISTPEDGIQTALESVKLAIKVLSTKFHVIQCLLQYCSSAFQ